MYHKAKLYKASTIHTVGNSIISSSQAVRETELDIKLVGFEDRGESEITSQTADQEVMVCSGLAVM